MPERNFDQLFSSAYDRAKTTGFGKVAAMRESLALDASIATQLGHPDFESLKVGETADGEGVVFFLDIRGFTKLSFVLSNKELLWILQALTEAAVESVLQYNGHVIEFTGDGIMAVFGDSRMASEESAFAALHTTSFLMKGVQDYVNPRLEHFGTEPIRTAVGMEFGDILWSRIGVLNRSQVKPISEATFLAGKLSCGGKTKSWEAMVGANLAEWIPEEFKTSAKKYEFVANGVEYSRDLFLFKWEQFVHENLLRPKEFRKLLVERKLRPRLQKSPYLTSLKLLTEAGYNVYLDESSDCPHLVVELSRAKNISAILAFDSNSGLSEPSIFLKARGNLEKIDLDPVQWEKSGRNLVAMMAAVRSAAQ